MSTPNTVLPNGRLLRYTFVDRMTHWVVAGSFIYLMVTGLAFWTPWLFWLATVFGGPQVSRMLHPWIGLIFSGALIYMFMLWAAQMHTTETDKAWWNSLRYYITNQDDKMPPAGRYNFGQKLLFWGFVICGALLLLSGLALWFPENIPWGLRFLRYIAVIVHPGAAMLTIGLFLIHIYMSVFAERGAMDAVVFGDVSQHFAKRYHPAWYKEVMDTSPPRK